MDEDLISPPGYSPPSRDFLRRQSSTLNFQNFLSPFTPPGPLPRIGGRVPDCPFPQTPFIHRQFSPFPLANPFQMRSRLEDRPCPQPFNKSPPPAHPPHRPGNEIPPPPTVSCVVPRFSFPLHRSSPPDLLVTIAPEFPSFSSLLGQTRIRCVA